VSDRFALPPVEAIDGLSAEALPAAMAHLAALQARAAARLAEATNNGNRPELAEDRLLDLAQAAELLGTTDDWLKRHPELPFVVRVSPGQIRYSARALQRFIALRIGK
jgi:hypothetical protein